MEEYLAYGFRVIKIWRWTSYFIGAEGVFCGFEIVTYGVEKGSEGLYNCKIFYNRIIFYSLMDGRA